MKRIVLLLATLCVGYVQAQTVDTLEIGDRLPNLYYWGTNWIDSHYDGSNYVRYDTYLIGDAFLGRVCITDGLFPVIGLAAAVTFDKLANNNIFGQYHYGVIDTVLSHRLPEYFRLYQVESDEYTLLADVRWDTATPQHCMKLPGVFGVWNYYNLYEIYFEKNIWVHDTFCVGGTTYNNMMHGVDSELVPQYPEAGLTISERMPTVYPLLRKDGFSSPYIPNPPYFVTTFYHEYSAYNVSSMQLHAIWHDTTAFRKVYPSTNPNSNTTTSEFWVPFFAIFDTNYVPGVGIYSDTCTVPGGLHLEGMDEAGVTMAWNAEQMYAWQLMLERADGEGEPLELMTPINYVMVDGLEKGCWYVARVRSFCDSMCFSGWSDPLMFYIPLHWDSCAVPTWLHVESADSATVTLGWNMENATLWELESGCYGIAQGAGAVQEVMNNEVTLTGLDTNAWYWARVRAVCDTDWWSEWTDTVCFYVPSTHQGAPDDTTGSAITLAEQYTYLMPNPAREEVTVASSFRVKAVELYGADGKLLQRKEVNAVGTTLDLKGLPTGIYFVRVATHAGVTTKRLVVTEHGAR